MIKSKKTAAIALATALAIPAEGLRQYAYYDPPGILTVCYGTTGADVVKGRKYSLEECKAFLARDMQDAVEQVHKCHPNLPTEVLAAFADATYNLGPKVACDSTASRLLGQGKIEAACNELPRWNKARVAGVLIPLPGLTSRRLKEQELCFAGSLAPWLIIGFLVSTLAAGGIGYIKGQSAAEAEQASKELLIAQAAQEAQKATAEVIAQIKIRNTTINKEIQRETRTVPVYSDCRNTEPSMQLINGALTGAKPSGDIKLPRISGDTAR